MWKYHKKVIIYLPSHPNPYAFFLINLWADLFYTLWRKLLCYMLSGFVKAPQRSIRVIHYRLLKVFWIHAKAFNLRCYACTVTPAALRSHLCACIFKLMTRLVWTYMTANDIWHVCSYKENYCMALEEYSTKVTQNPWFCDPQMKRRIKWVWKNVKVSK